MKRLICLVLVCLAIVIMLASCGETQVGEFIPATDKNTDSRFQEIGWEKLANHTGNRLEEVIYYYDEYTNIVYAYFIDWNANATRGMMTVLYDADGTPMTLEEFMN